MWNKSYHPASGTVTPHERSEQTTSNRPTKWSPRISSNRLRDPLAKQPRVFAAAICCFSSALSPVYTQPVTTRKFFAGRLLWTQYSSPTTPSFNDAELSQRWRPPLRPSTLSSTPPATLTGFPPRLPEDARPAVGGRVRGIVRGARREIPEGGGVLAADSLQGSSSLGSGFLCAEV